MPFQIVDRIPDKPWDAVVCPTTEGSEEGLSAAQIVHNKDYSEYAHLGTVAFCHYTLALETPRSCRYTIQTPLPQRPEMFSGEEIIRHCYKSALQIVHDFELEKVAFPLIDARRKECPKELALQIATEEITKFLEDHEDTDILLVVRDKREFCPDSGLLSGLSEYIRRVREEERRARELENMLENASTGAFPAITAEDIEAERRRQELTVIPTAPAPPAQAPRESSPKSSRGGIFSGFGRRKRSAPPDEDEEWQASPRPYGSIEPISPSAGKKEGFDPDHSSASFESIFPSAGKENGHGQLHPISYAEAYSEPDDEEGFEPDHSSASFEEGFSQGEKDEFPLDAPFTSDCSFVLDESFSQMVLRLIDEKGFKKDSDCYYRANIDRRLFSKLRCDMHYHPKKTTALALAIALELTLSETKELLTKAGYSLSRSILLDVIVEYCILQRVYDVFKVNEMLFEYDQPLLGG